MCFEEFTVDGPFWRWCQSTPNSDRAVSNIWL